MEKTKLKIENDQTASSRKIDHIQLTFNSQTLGNDHRFYYEPLLGHHDLESIKLKDSFAGFNIGAPLWISSMTGGTELAKTLNNRLSQVAGEYGIPMGLGSCRSLLYSDERFHEFDIKSNMNGTCFFANLGIAQIDELIREKETSRVGDMINKLGANGLIIHINPLQEWFQPEGDRINRPSIEILEDFLDSYSENIIIKEVGQGFGPKSLEALLKLPLMGIDFGAFGGTNFSMIEKERRGASRPGDEMVFVGQTAEEMVNILNSWNLEEKASRVPEFIISGGVKSFLDGHYLMEKLTYSSIYAQASMFLKKALECDENPKALENYIKDSIYGLKIAKAFLTLRK